MRIMSSYIPSINSKEIASVFSVVALLLTFVAVSGFSSFNSNDEETRAEHFNLDNGVALDGNDPVAYFTEEAEVEGSSEYSETYQGVTYYFSSEENLETFREDPESFEPKYGGYCAYTMLDGEKQDVNTSTFKIIDDELYFFDTMFFGAINAKSRWNDMIEETEGGEAALVEQADAHWQEIIQN